MDASNPRILYAAIWQAKRTPWTMISGGPGSGLFKTTDGGNTWVELTEGLPEGVKGRIAVTVSPAAPNRVWALVEHEEGGVFRSDNGGKKFRRVSSDRELRQRAWYYTHLEADPQDANTVYVLNVMFWRSVDGGTSFRPIRVPHGDNHALWINPDDPANFIQANDGGANISFNGGRSWSTQQNQPTSEIYRLTVDDRYPYWLYGGQQDNSAVAIPSRSPGGIAWRDWYAPAGCETATVAVDPRNPNITYGGCYGGSIGRHDHELEQEQEVMAWPQMAVGQQAKDLRYRFQWNSPIRISPHDPSVLYHCANVVLRSKDEGRSWEEISPDLTRDDESKQGYAGEPITMDNTGVEVYGTIFAFEESPHRAGLLWAGSDDGVVSISEDNGGTWRTITPAGHAGVGDGQRHRAVGPRSRPRLHRRPSLSRGRLPALHLPHRRLRRQLDPADERLERHPRRPLRARRARGPGPQGPALRRHRVWDLRVLRRRGELEGVPAQPAGHSDHRHGGQAWRSRDLHPGAVVLDPGRPQRPPPAERRGQKGRLPISSIPGRWCGGSTVRAAAPAAVQSARTRPSAPSSTTRSRPASTRRTPTRSRSRSSMPTARCCAACRARNPSVAHRAHGGASSQSSPSRRCSTPEPAPIAMSGTWPWPMPVWSTTPSCGAGPAVRRCPRAPTRCG